MVQWTFISQKNSLIDQQQQIFFCILHEADKFCNFSLFSKTMLTFVCLEGFGLEYAGNFINPQKNNSDR